MRRPRRLPLATVWTCHRRSLPGVLRSCSPHNKGASAPRGSTPCRRRRRRRRDAGLVRRFPGFDTKSEEFQHSIISIESGQRATWQKKHISKSRTIRVLDFALFCAFFESEQEVMRLTCRRFAYFGHPDLVTSSSTLAFRVSPASARAARTAHCAPAPPFPSPVPRFLHGPAPRFSRLPRPSPRLGRHPRGREAAGRRAAGGAGAGGGARGGRRRARGPRRRRVVVWGGRPGRPVCQGVRCACRCGRVVLRGRGGGWVPRGEGQGRARARRRGWAGCVGMLGWGAGWSLV